MFSRDETVREKIFVRYLFYDKMHMDEINSNFILGCES
ncbi:hypothetical protein CUZ96_0338 [Enterococcus lactis]|nr:hypothetical protein [Enterococcus lactis]